MDERLWPPISRVPDQRGCQAYGGQALPRQSHVVVSCEVRGPHAIAPPSPSRRYQRLPPSLASANARQPGQPLLRHAYPRKGKKKFPVSDGRTLGLTAEAPAGGDRSLQAVPADSLLGLLGVKAAPRTRWCQFLRALLRGTCPPHSLSLSLTPVSLCLSVSPLSLSLFKD